MDTTSHEFEKLIDEVMVPIAPNDQLTAVTFTHAGAAVEKAIMTAMAERGKGNWTALTFAGSYRSAPSFALQHYHTEAGKWSSADYPKSPSEDSSALDQIRTQLREARSANRSVAALVVAPVQCGTGFVASDNFLKELRGITQDTETALIVDETYTGCGATGKGFWSYTGPADYVVFGKKT